MGYYGYGSSWGGGTRSTVGFRTNRYDDDDYYYNSKKKSYKSWSWGCFGTFSFEEDDDRNLLVKSCEGYYTPTNDTIRSELRSYHTTSKNCEVVKDLSRFFYYRMIDEKDFWIDEVKDPENIPEKYANDYAFKSQLFEPLWDKFIPGDTPLQKAVNVFKQLMDKKEPHRKNEKELNQKDLESTIEFHEEIYQDPDINELLNANLLASKDKFKMLNYISLLKDLGTEFKVEKEIDEKIVANSRLVTQKMMRDYSQIVNVEMYQRMLPTFQQKFLTKDLTVNVPIDRTEKKQKIIILLDFSGSMRSGDKQQWVTSILVDRLSYVMKEEAEVFFSYFVHEPDDLNFFHLYDRKSVLDFWRIFSNHPNGGDTNIGGMVNYIKNEIEQKRLHNLNVDLSADKPEILVIHDGQDSVKTNQFTYKTNAITMLDGVNEQLKKLCINNDGKYVYINDTRTVDTYSKAGKQTLKI